MLDAEAAVKLGLTNELFGRIQDAQLERPGHDPKMRSDLLEACQVKEMPHHKRKKKKKGKRR